jgi:hypothetical protein
MWHRGTRRFVVTWCGRRKGCVKGLIQSLLTRALFRLLAPSSKSKHRGPQVVDPGQDPPGSRILYVLQLPIHVLRPRFQLLVSSLKLLDFQAEYLSLGPGARCHFLDSIEEPVPLISQPIEGVLSLLDELQHRLDPPEGGTGDGASSISRAKNVSSCSTRRERE